MRLIPLFLLCSLLAAGEAPLPPKLDAAYRAYLAALAKTYQAETAKLDATLKKEAAAGKRDPTLAAAVEALQAKLAKHEHLDDFAALVKGDVLDAGRIAGGADQLIGTWDEKPTTFRTLATTQIVIQPKGRALVRSVNAGAISEQSASWEVVTKDGAQVFVLYRSEVRDEKSLNRGAYAVNEITLPLPAGATAVETMFRSAAMSAAGAIIRAQDPRRWSPVVEEKPVQKMVR